MTYPVYVARRPRPMMRTRALGILARVGRNQYRDTHGARPSEARVAGRDRTPSETDSAIITSSVRDMFLPRYAIDTRSLRDDALTHSSLPIAPGIRYHVYQKGSSYWKLTTTPWSCISPPRLSRHQMHPGTGACPFRTPFPSILIRPPNQRVPDVWELPQ